MNTDLTIGYIVHDGTYAVVEDRTFVARCSNRQQAERVRAALSAADELAAMRTALQKQQDVEDHETECLYCLHDDPCNIRARLAADAGVTRADILAAASPTTPDGGSGSCTYCPPGACVETVAKLAAASPTTADHPYSLSLPEGASIHVPCCDLPQSRHPSLGEPFSPTTADGRVYVCVECGLPITGGVKIGMGDGNGQKFGHRSCYWRAEAKRDAQTVTDLVDLIHAYGSDELIAMADERVASVSARTARS